MDTPLPPEQDLITDLAAVVAATSDQVPAQQTADSSEFSWEVDGDVLRGLILRAS